MEVEHVYDSGDNVKNAGLAQRLSKVNGTLSNLKKQLDLERHLLNQRKKEMNRNSCSISENKYLRFSNISGPSREDLKTSRAPKNNKSTTVTLNKQHLKEIEKRCEQELDKLNEYIFSVNEFKGYWIQLREAEKAKSRTAEHLEKTEYTEYTENTFFEKKYPRGKIFYVDNDLY